MAEDFEFDIPPAEEGKKTTSRTFITAAAGIGGLLILSLICLGLYTLVIAPRQREAREQRPTEIALTNTEIARRLTEMAGTEISPEDVDTATPTASITPSATETEGPSTATPTVTNTPEPSETPLVATAQATTRAVTPTSTPTALPGTGFADDIGIPGMLLLAAAMVIVIFVARHLRTRSA